ncbi:MAG: hypothetical protein ACE5NL_01585, partial [Candidatus Hydrothermarchaeaceae archaeon]
LNALKIPRFVMLKIKDRERISKLMEEFFKSSPIGDKSLSDVEKEIKETDKTIDQKVYESHGLTENEIGIIERS